MRFHLRCQRKPIVDVRFPIIDHSETRRWNSSVGTNSASLRPQRTGRCFDRDPCARLTVTSPRDIAGNGDGMDFRQSQQRSDDAGNSCRKGVTAIRPGGCGRFSALLSRAGSKAAASQLARHDDRASPKPNRRIVGDGAVIALSCRRSRTGESAIRVIPRVPAAATRCGVRQRDWVTGSIGCRG